METFRIKLEEINTARPFTAYANGVKCYDINNLSKEVASYLIDTVAFLNRRKARGGKVVQSALPKKRKALRLTIAYESDGLEVGTVIDEFGAFLASVTPEVLAEDIADALKLSETYGHVWGNK
jgi:hypothetical protein